MTYVLFSCAFPEIDFLVVAHHDAVRQNLPSSYATSLIPSGVNSGVIVNGLLARPVARFIAEYRPAPCPPHPCSTGKATEKAFPGPQLLQWDCRYRVWFDRIVDTLVPRWTRSLVMGHLLDP